ncbi:MULTISPECIES: DUF1835 domain-containing protein [unclassified Paenibacillus]|uniref:DUF1835 domain-containing protein n=1 Tax=unclassified Paenibacillus TaxID=185978 RepID=UPI00020D72F8|nr:MULTISPECIES: DUF1835 domain-containing protein [unclassified Paenibacillus]EGL15124.1 hypothetical protein HMPREF9413_2297 [Paenibacillus sp. HGF7]EPD93561.1 hypothetical protein HMPREF1207_00127 [Paenibacillus sp. HGH0039]
MEQIRKLKEREAPLETSVSELIELYDELIESAEKKAAWDPVPTCTRVHFVVGYSFAGSIKAALKQLNWSGTHKVITLSENYAIGPIHGLDSYEGRKARRDWFQDHITEPFEVCDDPEEDYGQLLERVNKIPEQAKVIVWTSRNACEQTGMLHAFRLLSGRSNSLALYDACTICEELDNRPNATISYRHSGEIPSDKLQAALVRMDDSSFLKDADKARLEQEWQTISKQSGALRIWRDGAVTEVPDDYYDMYLLDKLDKLRPASDSRYLKAARLIGEAMGCCEQYIGDAYFEFRLRQLIYEGILEIKGVPSSMRRYSVRRKKLSSN